jgi:heavy metal translocating P-type ATPase
VKKNTAVSLAAVLLIALHVCLRFIFRASELVSDTPLFLSLLIGGIPLIVDVASGLRRREFSTDVLAGISVVTSILLGEYLAGAIIVLMYSGGGALEDHAVKNASSVLRALAKRMPSVAHLKRGAELLDIGAEDIQTGDSIEVFPHEICPVDGVVTEGHGTMNEAYLTGEPFQIDKAPGASVISGAVNGELPLTIVASKRSVDSRYAKIVEVLRESEKNKPHLRRLAERLSAFYTPLALSVASLAWLISSDAKRFLAVLVIATPCPLLIAIPVAILGAISLSAKRGIIVKNPSVLELIEDCRIAIFDKTGTLTLGEPGLSEAICASGYTEKGVLRFAASLERYSKHPLSLAILKAARDQKLALHEASEIRVVPGLGLTGIVVGHKVRITGRNYLDEAMKEKLPSLSVGLECVILMDEEYAATLRFHDTPRAEGASFVRHLEPKHAFDRAIIVSGDREAEVRYLASKVGITEIYAEKSPEEKLSIVKKESQTAKTLYVGDGINDAPALMAATVGVAIGKNGDITSQAAGAVIMDSSLEKVDELMHISRHFKRIALQSAVGGIALSFIGMGLAVWGHLTPVLGALAQEGIDLLAIVNALRTALPPKKLSDFK